MKTLPTQARALRKRAALIDAAISEYSTVGFELATAKSIAARAGVATGTFYQYFENKNDILCVIAADRFETLHQRIKMLKLHEVIDEGTSVHQIEVEFLSVLEFVYRFHSAEPELHQVLEQRRALDSELRVIMDQGEELIKHRVLAFVQSFNLPDADIIADNLFAMAEGLVHRLAFTKSDFTQSGQDANKALRIGAEMLASYFLSNIKN